MSKRGIRLLIAFILGVIILGTLYLVINNKKITQAGKDFKHEYEAINGKEAGHGSAYRKISISENNKFKHVSQKEVLKKLENNETFYLYVGDKKCPWCRSAIEKAVEVSNKAKNVKEIYYVNIWDEDFNEVLRDKYKLNDNESLEKVNDGTKLYKLMLKRFNKVLNDYNLNKEDGTKVEVGEKRVYAPNYFYIKNGKAKKMVEGTSDKQEGAFDKLTKEMLKDEEDIFKEFFKN
jgi:thiol-disulfide isomerase/thioredoxin